MKVNRLLAGTLAIVLIAGFATPSFAQPLGTTSTPSETVFPPLHGNVDQSFTGPFTQLAFVEPLTIPGGQTFTPTASNLVGVDVFAGSFPGLGGPDTVTINVWDSNQPGVGNLLGSASVNIDTTGTSAASPLTVHLDFTTIPLVPGNTHALQFIVGIEDGTLFEISCNDPYPGGIFWQGIPFPNCDLGFVTYFEEDEVPVGGEFLPIETTSLLLAGAQSFSWMIPVIVSAVGIGIVIARKF